MPNGDLDTEVSVTMFFPGGRQVSWTQGPYTAASGLDRIALDLSAADMGSLVAVSVLATSLHPETGEPVGHHGIDGFAYKDATGAVRLLSDATARSVLGVVAAEVAMGGEAEEPDLVGMGVTP